MEPLETREVFSGLISIGDAIAIEGSKAVKPLDVFVTTGSGGLDVPRGITFGPNGSLFVVSSQTDSVLRYDGETGTLLGDFVAPGSGGLDGPFDLKFGPDGDLYVSSFDAAFTVNRYDGDTGAFVATFVAAGSGGLTQPTGLLFTPGGDLLVSSYNSGQVLKYRGPNNALPGQPAVESLGEFASTGTGSTPDFMTFGPDNALYVGCPNHLTPTANDAVVKRFDGSTGVLIDTFVQAGSGGMGDIRAVLFDDLGDLLVADTTQDAILRYQGPNGVSPGAFIDAAVAPGVGGLNNPIGATTDAHGNLFVASRDTDNVLRYGASSQAAFTVSLDAPSGVPVVVNYSTSDGSASAGDYFATSGTITFAPGETTHTVIVKTLDDILVEGSEAFNLNLSDASGATILDGSATGTIKDDDATKFYVVDDGSVNQTYEYADGSNSIESYTLNSGNTSPRGAASTALGDKVWSVDANRKVYVYNTSGGLLGSWTAGTLASNATVEGITTNGTDVWIVDARSDKVYKYTGAASRLSGSQNAASSFTLNISNRSPKDLVTDGTYLYVINDSSTDKVFKYTLSGSLVGSWTMSGGGGSPTGITLDPSNVSHLWVVDNATDRIYQYDAAVSRTSGSQTPSTSFALAAGNTNPQGIADPPPASASLSDASVAATESEGTDVFASWNGPPVTSPSSRWDARMHESTSHRTLTASSRVDAVMNRWDTGSEPQLLATRSTRTEAAVARRAGRAGDLDLLGSEWDDAIDALADALAARN